MSDIYVIHDLFITNDPNYEPTDSLIHRHEYYTSYEEALEAFKGMISCPTNDMITDVMEDEDWADVEEGFVHIKTDHFIYSAEIEKLKPNKKKVQS